MNAKDRAAAIAAATAQAQLRAGLAKGINFPALGVSVKGGEVRVISARLFGPGKLLGPLKDPAPPDDLVPSRNVYGPGRTSLGYGMRNGSCTTFVAFEGGQPHTRRHILKHPRIIGMSGAVDGSVIDAQIAKFNQLADLAYRHPPAGTRTGTSGYRPGSSWCPARPAASRDPVSPSPAAIGPAASPS